MSGRTVLEEVIKTDPLAGPGVRRGELVGGTRHATDLKPGFASFVLSTVLSSSSIHSSNNPVPNNIVPNKLIPVCGLLCSSMSDPQASKWLAMIHQRAAARSGGRDAIRAKKAELEGSDHQNRVAPSTVLHRARLLEWLETYLDMDEPGFAARALQKGAEPLAICECVSLWYRRRSID